MSTPDAHGLLPCPFCGSAPAGPIYQSARIYVHCRCSGLGPSVWTGGPNPTREAYNEAEAKAVEAWNARVPLPPAARSEPTLGYVDERDAAHFNMVDGQPFGEPDREPIGDGIPIAGEPST